MNANEKIYIRHYCAETVEDVFDQGEVGSVCSSWSDRDLPVSGRYDSVRDALAAVLEANYFKDNPEAWTNWAKDFGKEEAGRFSFSTLVDVENSEADKSYIARWMDGQKRLWVCTLNVWLGIVAEREMTEMEAVA